MGPSEARWLACALDRRVDTAHHIGAVRESEAHGSAREHATALRLDTADLVARRAEQGQQPLLADEVPRAHGHEHAALGQQRL